jgi:hypothetical protein
MPEKIEAKKKGCIFILCFYFSQFILFVSTKLFNFGLDSNWYIYAITVWFFIFILHFIKVFITDRFMNKNWEREQIDRLVALQKNKLTELQAQITEDTSTKELEL